MVPSPPPAVLTLSYPSPAELSYETIGPSSRRTALAITEIMYHPPTRADGRNTEFIEIYNSNPFAEDLSGYSRSEEHTSELQSLRHLVCRLSLQDLLSFPTRRSSDLYHPPTRADGRNTEFIEIYNSNPFAEDLSGYS